MAALARLTDAAFAAETARMAGFAARVAALRKQLATLDEGLNDHKAGDPADPATKAGADLRWRRWVASRRLALNGEMARALAAQDAARLRLARAFGRHQAAITLAGKLRQEARADRVRRED
jgi:hypothetical protein